MDILSYKLGKKAGAKPEQAKSVTYVDNGSYTAEPDSGKVLSSVSITVDLPPAAGNSF